MTTYSGVNELVDNAMVELVLGFPIFANLLARIGVKVTDNKAVPAMAYTDGTGIYINAPFVDYANNNPIVTTKDGREIDQRVTKERMMFILCHELMHLLNLTYDRGLALGIERKVMGTDKEMANKFDYWNQATDYEINSLLANNEKADGSRDTIGELPENCLYKSEYRNLTAEEIYKRIYEPLPNIEVNICGGSGNDSDTGDNPLDVPGNVIGLDIHMPILDDTTRSELTQKVGELLGNRQNGTGSSAIDRALEIAYKPIPFNWRKALTKYIRGWMKDNYTWNKPSRAGMANNVILPSAGQTPKLHLAVAVDTSGSISDIELNTMMQHLYTILQQFKDFTIDVWCCGSEVYENTFKTYKACNKKDIVNFKFESDGGNDMRKNFAFLEKHYKGQDKPDVFLILSDFYDPLNGDNETTSICPVIGLVIDHPDFVKPSKMKFTAFPFEVENGKQEC